MSKKNLILGGIFVVLLLFIYLLQGPLQDRGKGLNFMADLNMEEVDRIEIETADGSAVLLKEEKGKWKVEGEGDFYMRPSLAENMEKEMQALTETEFELVSGEADRKSEFETDDEQGALVKLYKEEEELKRLVVGTLDPTDYNDTYVSQSDIDETYSAKGVDLRSIFKTQGGDWRNRAIFDTPMEDIDRVRFQYPNREFTVVKATTTDEEGEEVEEWQGSTPWIFEVDQEKMEEVVMVMSELWAADIPEQDFEGTGLADHLIIVEATGEDLENTIMVGHRHEPSEETEEELAEEGLEDIELYYAKRADSDNIYLISEQEKNILDQSIDSLR